MNPTKPSLWGRPELYLGLIVLFFFFVAPYVNVELMRSYRIGVPGYEFLSADELPSPAWRENAHDHLLIPGVWWLFMGIVLITLLSLIFTFARKLALSRILLGIITLLAVGSVILIPYGKVKLGEEDNTMSDALMNDEATNAVMESFTYEYESDYEDVFSITLKAGAGLWFTAFLGLMGVFSNQVVRFFGGGPRKTVTVYRTVQPVQQRSPQNLPPEEDPFWDTDGKG